MKQSLIAMLVVASAMGACAAPALTNTRAIQTVPRAVAPSATGAPQPTLVAPKPSPQSSPTGQPKQPPPPGASSEQLRQFERSFLSQVTAVQTWREIAVIGERENFAPSIITLRVRDGNYRIYWNSVRDNGVTSATSKDGVAFTKESGVRLKSGAAGEKDCIASHPWAVAVDNGYRMYYQGDAKCKRAQNEQPEYRIFSAFSSDGLSFAKEGVRVDIGANGLTQAAHGRVLRMDDGTYRMWFSANFAGKNQPADILGASSKDALTWTLDAEPTLERAHDPTVIKLGGKIYIYTTFLGDNFIILESSDGLDFTPTSWVDFYDKNGKRYEEFGDVDILQIADGRVLIYGSGKGSQGVSILEQEKPQTAAPTATSAPSASKDLSACKGDDPIAASGAAGPGGLAAHQLYQATSADGKVFTGDNVLLVNSASVPDAVVRPDGSIWVYFVNGEKGKHGIFVAQGTASGSFQIVDCVKINGRFEPTAVDPDIVRLSDGRYRLYYYANLGQTGGQNIIRRAVSTDGINFTVEGDVASGPYTDPTVALLAKGGWLMSIPRGREGNLVFSSADGARFDTASSVMVKDADGTPELAALADGRVRMYAGGGKGLLSFVSADAGKTWSKESETELRASGANRGAGNPSVVQLANGTWLLFYTAIGNP